MVYIILVLLGLCFGSFVNALTWRLKHSRNWISERSECSQCHHPLATMDLIPVMSWVWLRGKCRYCHKPIEDTPVVEVALPLLFVLSYAFWPVALHNLQVVYFSFWLVFLVGFLALVVYDLRWMQLPNKIVYTLLGLVLIQDAVVVATSSNRVQVLGNLGLSLVIAGGLFYGLFQYSKGKWIGGGDVKLGAMLGLLVASPDKALLLLFSASLLGSVAAVPLLLLGRAKRTTRLPFGPFLLIAAVIVQLFGTSLITWYKHRFLYL